MKYKADVILEFGEIPNIECIPSQINQVILNLIVNAAQATRDDTRGKITIKTYQEKISSTSNTEIARAEGDYVAIEICDQGTGINPENLSKIFDPFFTTKKIGVGTGLGLSVSHGIIQRHGGEITVSSIIDEGSCFKIVLPVNQSS